MKEIFLCVLSLSLSGALTGILLLLIRPAAGKYFPKSWRYYMWLLVAARLLLPVYIETDLSGVLSPHNIREQFNPGEEEKAAVLSVAGEEKEQETAAEYPKPEPAGISRQQEKGAFDVDWLQVAAYLWGIGIMVSLGMKIGGYRRFTHSVQKEWTAVLDARVQTAADGLCLKLRIKKPEIYESAAVSGPITMGMARPVIVLPTGERNFDKLPLVLHHELVHIKRRDLWYKWLYQIILCVHWFNPILYLVQRKLNADCELSCDEAVLSALTGEGKKAYGNVLLDTAEGNIKMKGNVLSVTLLERKEDLKERLKGIVRYQKGNGFKAMFSLCLSVMLLSLSACAGIEVSPDAVPFQISAERVLVDKNGEAWQAYDDDQLIGGKDISDQWHMNNYAGGERIICSGMFLNGAVSVMIANAPEDIDIQVNSEFDMREGKFKLVHVDPEGRVSVLNDTGEKTSVEVTMKAGRNVIKLVGQGAKIRELRVNYDHFREKDFESVFYSQEMEETEEMKAEIEQGNADKEKVMDNLAYLEDETVSKAFAALLEQGESFDAEELKQIIIYSNAELSAQYLQEAVRSGAAQPPSELAVSGIKAYLSSETLTQLLLAMGENLTFELLLDCAPYLDGDEMETCVKQYTELGNQLTEEQANRLKPYMDEAALEPLKPIKPLKPDT